VLVQRNRARYHSYSKLLKDAVILQDIAWTGDCCVADGSVYKFRLSSFPCVVNMRTVTFTTAVR